MLGPVKIVKADILVSSLLVKVGDDLPGFRLAGGYVLIKGPHPLRLALGAGTFWDTIRSRRS